MTALANIGQSKAVEHFRRSHESASITRAQRPVARETQVDLISICFGSKGSESKRGRSNTRKGTRCYFCQPEIFEILISVAPPITVADLS
jgi:PP-loop superfamily ATP-utilizing enzyme